MPKILQMVGYSALQIGIVFAMAPLMRFLVPFLFLKYIQLNRTIFYIALSVICLSAFSFYATIEHFYLFLLPNLALGSALGLILPYIETYAMEHLGKERFGKSRLYGSIGFMLIGIVLARNLDTYSVGLHYFFFWVLATILFGYLTTKDEQNSVHVSQKTNTFELTKVRYLWISIFFMQISFGAFYNFFTIYETAHGISLEMVSYLWAFGVICEIVFFYFQGPLLRGNLLRLIKFATFFASLRWLLLFLFPDFLLISFLSQSLHALTFALHHTAVLSLLYSVYHNKKLAGQFYYGFSFGLGGFVGAMLAGYFYGPNLYAYAATMAMISFLVLLKQKPIVPVQNS